MNAVSLVLPRVRTRRGVAIVTLCCLLFATAVWSLARGAIAIPAGDVGGALVRWMARAPAEGDDNVVLMLRLPRGVARHVGRRGPVQRRGHDAGPVPQSIGRSGTDRCVRGRRAGCGRGDRPRRPVGFAAGRGMRL